MFTAVNYFDMFSIYGDMHNSVLGYTLNNVDSVILSTKQKDAGLDYIASIQKCGVNNLSLPSVSNSDLLDYIETYKGLYEPSVVAVLLGMDGDELNFETSLTGRYLTTLLNSEVIDNFEYELIIRIVNSIDENRRHGTSIKDYMIDLENAKKCWLIQYDPLLFLPEIELDEESGGILNKRDIRPGDITALILNISISSANFWMEMPDEPDMIAPWVAADAGGAIFGAVYNIAVTIANEEEIDWESVGYSAAGGAIAGSTGIGGKIGRWLFK